MNYYYNIFNQMGQENGGEATKKHWMDVRPSNAASIEAPFKNGGGALGRMKTLNWDAVIVFAAVWLLGDAQPAAV